MRHGEYWMETINQPTVVIREKLSTKIKTIIAFEQRRIKGLIFGVSLPWPSKVLQFLTLGDTWMNLQLPCFNLQLCVKPLMSFEKCAINKDGCCVAEGQIVSVVNVGTVLWKQTRMHSMKRKKCLWFCCIDIHLIMSYFDQLGAFNWTKLGTSRTIFA